MARFLVATLTNEVINLDYIVKFSCTNDSIVATTKNQETLVLDKYTNPLKSLEILIEKLDSPLGIVKAPLSDVNSPEDSINTSEYTLEEASEVSVNTQVEMESMDSLDLYEETRSKLKESIEKQEVTSLAKLFTFMLSQGYTESETMCKAIMACMELFPNWKGREEAIKFKVSKFFELRAG